MISIFLAQSGFHMSEQKKLSENVVFSSLSLAIIHASELSCDELIISTGSVVVRKNDEHHKLAVSG